MEIRIERALSSEPAPAPAELGFGKFFTPHMFRARYDQGWSGAAIVPRAPLALDPAASVLHYGQAVFEGLKAFRGSDGKIRLFRPDLHAKRFAISAARICLPAVPNEMFLGGVAALVDIDSAAIPHAPDTSLYVRPTLIGTEGYLGVRPSSVAEFFIIASPVGPYWQGGRRPLSIWIETEFVRAASGGTGAAKFPGNYAASLLAAERAKARGFDQVLWTDARHHAEIEEIGTMNLFVRIGETVVTPPLADTILSGVTRDAALTLLRAWKVPVEERALSVQEIERAHAAGQLAEMFGTGTAAVVAPIGRLGTTARQIVVGNGEEGELTRRLYDTITSIQRGTVADTYGWLVDAAAVSPIRKSTSR